MQNMGKEATANLQMAVPLFIVHNMEASLQFYVDGLGFSIEKQWVPQDKIAWCWLSRDGVALMLQEPDRDHPGYKGPAHFKGVGVSLCFQCMDALALYREFTTHSIAMKEPFVGNNMWVVHMQDPDGYHIEFESPTDVPEETTYSGWFK